MIVTRDIKAEHIFRSGGLIDGKLPIIPDDIYEAGNYRVISVTPAINQDIYRCVFEIGDSTNITRNDNSK